MNIVLFDAEAVWQNLLPFTFTRPVAEIRLGIFTIREKWEIHLSQKCSYSTKVHLQKKFPLKSNTSSLFICSNVFPNAKLVKEVKSLRVNQALYKKGLLIAFVGVSEDRNNTGDFKKIESGAEVSCLNNVWDIYKLNADAIEKDFTLIKGKRKSQKLSSTVKVIGNKSKVFLERGVKAEACIFNTNEGPIYIGKNAEVMEGTAIRGPFVLGEHSVLKLNTKIYGATSIGPHCKVGGEVNNSVIFGYSNKAHDGFLGNSVIGEWCNLGADTNNSNLKNNYGNVKLYNFAQKKMLDTGLQFCGLFMGDHSKSGINTMFNTGTVVGVGANIFGSGFPPTYIPNFSWGGSDGFKPYRLEKLFETAEKMFERRGMVFDSLEKEILTVISKTQQ